MNDTRQDVWHALAVARSLADARQGNLKELALTTDALHGEIARIRASIPSSVSLLPETTGTMMARLEGLASDLARLATGYTAVSGQDWVYPDAVSDLNEHGWTRVPSDQLGLTVPPGIPAGAELGYRCDWTRGDVSISFWFTSPDSFRYAWASHVGRLFDREPSAVVCAEVDAITGTRELPRGLRWTNDSMFNERAHELRTYVERHGWQYVSDYTCDGHGQARTNGAYRGSIFHAPSDPGYRLYVWGKGNEAARCGYWAGPVTCRAQLDRLLARS